MQETESGPFWSEKLKLIRGGAPNYTGFACKTGTWTVKSTIQNAPKLTILRAKIINFSEHYRAFLRVSLELHKWGRTRRRRRRGRVPPAPASRGSRRQRGRAWGGVVPPLPTPLPRWGGGHPLPTPHTPRRLRRLVLPPLVQLQADP